MRLASEGNRILSSRIENRAMQFHKIAADGSLDESRIAEYYEHLDAISERLPKELYQILREPRAAYLSGRSFYDSTVVQWHENMQLKSSQSILAVSVIEAWRKWRFVFEFQNELEVRHLSSSAGLMLGRLYFLEVTRANDGRMAFSFIDSIREETVVMCRDIIFREEHLS